MEIELEKPMWERVAESRWGQYVSSIERDTILVAQRLAGTPTLALEVGCEGGRWSKMLAELGWRLICTDINERTLALCQQRIPEATCIRVQPSDETLPVEAGAVALLLIVEVPYVIERDWFMHEAQRVLANGGILVGVHHNRRSLRGLFYQLMWHLKKRQGYPFYQVSYPLWCRELRAMGFEIVAEEGCCWFPMRRESNSRLVPVVTRLEFALGLRRLASVSPFVVFIARKIA